MYKQITCEKILYKVQNRLPIKYGLFLARLQPLHIGHLYVIEKALEECDALIILVGSSNKNGTLRNPYDVKLRLRMLNDALKTRNGYDRVAIDFLPDWAGEDHKPTFHQWGHYLYYNVVSRILYKSFTMYYSDEPEKALCWFDEEVADKIEFRFFDRSNILNGVSSTAVRDALERLEDDDITYLKWALPAENHDKIKELSEIWRQVKMRPFPDVNIV